MSVTEQFAGLEMDNLIGGPLTAASKASISLARSTADIINQVGFDAEGKVRTAEFGYQKRTPNNDGTSNLEEMKVEVPILALVPIPNLQIDEINNLFDMEVKQSEKSEKAFDLGASVSGSAKFGPVSVNITGNVSSHSSNTRSTDNSAKYHVDLRATNHGTPEGLARVLDMMSASISPVLVDSSLKDGDGKELSDAAKAKAENMKRLRNETAALENQVSASQEVLDTNISRFLNIADDQFVSYQTVYAKMSSQLSDSDEDKAKRNVYEDTISKVNSSWNGLRKQIKNYIKIIASEDNAEDTISPIFGLKSLTVDNDTLVVDDYKEGQSQYSALLGMQKSTVEAQKKYNELVNNLLEKKAEYNNAIIGVSTTEVDEEEKNRLASIPSVSANSKQAKASDKIDDN